MTWLVTGAAGFIGTNLVKRLVVRGIPVVGLDDFSRPGVYENAIFLHDTFGFSISRTDISNRESTWTLLRQIEDLEMVVHLAGQVSFLKSIENPVRDFEVNVLGTINILEYLRLHSPSCKLIALSSNKVYGNLSHIFTREMLTRFIAPDWPNGFDESLPLDFHGPYGCSKGALDQYVADYRRTFGLICCSLRQSSVYGPHQHPQADQGWISHILQKVLTGETFNLNGIGKQVRDVLFVDDLIDLILRIHDCLTNESPSQFNVGGGVDNSLSLLELFQLIEDMTRLRAVFNTGPYRPSDQKVFISNNSRITEVTGWTPTTSVQAGISKLIQAFV